MKKIASYVSLLFCVILASCSDNNIDMGTVSYYPPFLFVEADTVPLVKTFEFEFSEDAKAEPSVFAEFEFVDNSEKPILPSELMVFVDGKQLKDRNCFRVTSADSKKEIKYIFTPTAKSGKHQGNLRLVRHNLHRLGNVQLALGQCTNVFQWTIYFDKKMNPLKLGLIYFFSILLVCILLWRFLIRKHVFKQFRAINKMVVIPNQAPISIRFKGARMVVLDNAHHKQSLWNSFWTGRIVYKYNSTLTTSITLLPTSKGRKILFKSDPSHYTCVPNPIDVGPSQITDAINHQNITIQ